MALTATDRGSGAVSSLGTSFTLAPNLGADCTAGALLVLCIAADNARSGGVAFTTFTVTDNVGGTVTWTRRAAPLYDPAGTSAGVEGAIFTRPTTAGALLQTSTVTVTFDTPCQAKAWTLFEVTTDIDGVAAPATSGVAGTGSATGTPSITIPGVVDGSMVVAAGFAEGSDSWVGDDDTTAGSWSTHQHNGIGSGNTGISVTSQRKVVTSGATQTYNPTRSSADCVLAYLLITEQATLRASVAFVELVLPGPFMPAAQAIGSAGQLAPLTSVALTGVAAVGEIENSFFGGSGQAFVAWVELELPEFSGGAIALTQKAAAGAIGALTPLSGVTGAYVAHAVLRLPPSNDIVLTGAAAVGGAGALFPIMDAVIVELVGVAALGEAGDLLEFQSAALTQKAAVGRIGELAPADLNYGYIGQLTPLQAVVLTQAAGTGRAGSMDVVGDGASSALLNGKAAPGVIGQLAPLQSLALTGRQALGRSGLVGVAFDYTAALTGVAAAGSAGILSESFDNPAYVFLGGMAAGATAGVLKPEGGVTLTGVAAQGVAGSFDFKGVMLIGVKATGSTGRFAIEGDVWTPKPPGGGIWEPVPSEDDLWVPV